jgi:hypothetical protein
MFEPRHHGEVQDLDTTPSQDLATGIQSSPGRINRRFVDGTGSGLSFLEDLAAVVNRCGRFLAWAVVP